MQGAPKREPLAEVRLCAPLRATSSSGKMNFSAQGVNGPSVTITNFAAPLDPS